jgi:hypothetical protein
MAQDGNTAGGNSYTIDNVTFQVGRNKLNSIFNAIRTTNIGGSQPELATGQFWIDNTTPSATVWTLYFFDGTDSIQFATIDTTNNTVNFIDSAFDLIVDTTPQLGGDLDLNSNDITGTGNIDITGTIDLTTSGANGLVINQRTDNAGNSANIFLSDSSGTVGIQSSSGAFRFNTDATVGSASGTERLRINSSELVINDTSNDYDFRVESNNNTHALFVNGGSGDILFNTSTSAINLITGTSVGMGYEASFNTLGISRSGGEPLNLNRTTSDGDIVRFRKDGATVGSIGTKNAPYFVNNTNGGIKLSGISVFPCDTTGAVADNTFDLGDGNSTTRWKDLYLTGTVTNNGTGGMSIDTSGNVTFNEGSIDADFRVESDTNTHALFVDGASGGIGIGTSTLRPAEFTPTDGVSINGNILGQIQSTTDSNTNILLNRDTTNGKLIEFRKNGTEVGSIGTTGGVIKVGSGDNNLGFFSDRIQPLDSSGAGTNNTIDVGYPSSRFKNGFFSGTIYTGKVSADELNVGTNEYITFGTIGSSANSILASANDGITYHRAYNGFNFIRSVDSVSQIQMTSVAGIVVNQDSADLDFRVESNSNTHMLFVDGGSNEVGIGLSAPETTLHVYGANNDIRGQLKVEASSGDAQITFEHPLNGRGMYVDNSDDNKFKIYGGGGKGVNEFTIDNTGNVGIGETSPTYPLSISSSYKGIQINDGTSTLAIFSNTAGQWINNVSGNNSFNVYTNDLQRLKIFGDGTTVINENSYDQDFRVESNNNTHALFVDGGQSAIGINNSLPTNLSSSHTQVLFGGVGSLLSGGTGAGSTSEVRANSYYDGANHRYSISDEASRYKQNDGIHQFDTASAGTAGNTLTWNTRMKINNSGYVLHTSSINEVISSNLTTHTIHNHDSSQRLLNLQHSGGGAVNGVLIDFDQVANDNNSQYFFSCDDAITNRLVIWSDGDIDNHDNSYGATSDIKLKEQVIDASSQWNDIKDLRIRKFKFKSDVSEKGDSDELWRLGLIAQEAELVSPNIVKTKLDFDKENNPILDDEGNQTETKSIKYSILYMKAVKALQEAMQKIEDLEARVNTLEGN